MKACKPAANLLVLSILLSLIVGASACQLAFAQVPTPISGADVTASSTTGGNGYGTATSNAQGAYNITSFLDSGNYSVTASAIGFIDTSIQNVRVTGGQETPNVNIMMPISGGISGRVTDAVSGTPLAFAFVEAINTTSSTTYGFSAFTDSNGNYLMYTDLATGIYNVSVSFATGYLSRTLTRISVIAGATTNNVNIALSKSATISGTVTDSVSSAALSGILVAAVAQNGTYVASAFTNSTGKYTLNTDLATGTYNVTVTFPTGHLPKTVSGVAVVAGNQYTVNVPIDPSGIISGRVTSLTTGAPISGATVSATAGSSFGFATTNQTGYYRITDGLATGSYTLFASYGGGFATMTGVSVTQGQETSNVNLQITLLPSGTISGRVTNSTSPLSGAYVSAVGLTGSGSAFTDDSGNYIINTGLLTGTYNVTAEATGYVTQTQTGISVTISQTTSNVNFQMAATPSGRISGLVQSTGTPIPEFHTEFYMLAIFCAASIIIVINKLRTAHVEPTKPL